MSNPTESLQQVRSSPAQPDVPDSCLDISFEDERQTESFTSIDIAPSAVRSSTTPSATAQDMYVNVAEAGLNEGRRTIAQNDNVAFLGEAFSLTYVLHNVLAPFLSTGPSYSMRLHYPIASSIRSSDSQAHMRTQRQREYLQKRRLYSSPGADLLQDLLQAYFDWFNPAFPILNREEFCLKVRDDKDVSLLLLNAVLMVSVSIYDNPLAQHNSSHTLDRHRERQMYFKQAKALYDEDLETNQTDLVSATFLMSFWWERADDPKDSWYWLGCATNLAQSIGMHRS